MGDFGKVLGFISLTIILIISLFIIILIDIDYILSTITQLSGFFLFLVLLITALTLLGMAESL